MDPFLALASDSLLTLSLHGYGYCPRAVAKLTALTRLKLMGFWPGSRVESFHGLRIQELVTIQSEGLAAWFLASGALSHLRSLHIDDDNDPSDVHEAVIEAKRAELKAVWAALNELPYLSQLSGCSELIEIGLKLSSGLWQETECPENALIKFGNRHGRLMWLKK